MALTLNNSTGMRFALAGALFCLVFASCKKDRNTDFTITNQQFVTEASSGNNFEVAAGAVAQTRGLNTSVRTYGEHMVTDHSAASVELKALADRKGLTVLAAGQMSDKHRQMLEVLVTSSAADFDKRFADIMVQSHKETVALFETASDDRGVSDLELRTMAAAKLPTLRAHLQQATDLRASLGQ